MINTCRYTIICSIIALIYACNPTFNNINEYLSWVNDPNNGLIKEKYVNSLKLTVKYLPPEYLAYLEKGENEMDAAKIDSIVEGYRKNRTFLITIAPDERTELGKDIMMANITSYQDYAERMLNMNFDFGELVTIKSTGEEYHPVLANMENTYGLTKGRNIYLVFAHRKGQKPITTLDELDFIFNDELFDTGINHFVFSKQAIDNIPSLDYKRLKK